MKSVWEWAADLLAEMTDLARDGRQCDGVKSLKAWNWVREFYSQRCTDRNKGGEKLDNDGLQEADSELVTYRAETPCYHSCFSPRQ